MKKTLTLLALTTAALIPMILGEARGDTKLITVTGVEIDTTDLFNSTGIYDANKDWNNRDNNMCWAAACSNLIAWWQDQQDPANLPEEMLQKDHAAIWDQYRGTFANYGGFTEPGLRWWIDGYYGEAEYNNKLKLRNYGLDPADAGYYSSSLYKSKVENADLKTLNPGNYTSVNNFCADLVSNIRNGYGVELTWVVPSIFDNVDSLGTHSVTLWGVQYDEESRLITNVYLTDSDDNSSKFLVDVPVYVATDSRGYTTLAKKNANGEYTVQSLTLLNSRLGNDLHYFNYQEENTHDVIVKQKFEDGSGFTITDELQEIGKIKFDGSRGDVQRLLTVGANKSVEAINVEARQGTNLVEVKEGMTLTAEEVTGSGLLTKTGEGTLKIAKDTNTSINVKAGVMELNGDASAFTGAVTVDGGTLLSENGALGDITLNNGGTLQGSGKFKNVTVNGGTLSVGDAPAQQKFTDGVLTLSQATLEFYVAGWERYASSLYGTGWSSGTYSNIYMSGANKLDVQSIDSIIFYVGGDALKALSTRNSLTLDIVDGINSYNFQLSMLEDMAANTKFIVAEGAPNDTNWQAGQDITQYINFKYNFNDNSWMYAPNSISLVGSFTGATPPAVPEPTTSTLSLLALANLCARRRRK